MMLDDDDYYDIVGIGVFGIGGDASHGIIEL